MIERTIHTKMGAIVLGAEGSHLVRLGFVDEPAENPSDRDAVSVDEAGSEAQARQREEARVLDQAERELDEYFAGARTEFTVPLAPFGTAFQKDVWKLLCAIPFGETRTYGDLAEKLGDKKKVRAVGGANGKNPIAIIVPCHRVIGKDGSMTGFASGIHRKEALLQLEGSLPRSLLA